jgi:hypothetical protein
MSHAENTKKFLSVTDLATRSAILDNIAEHYGITQGQAFEEVTDDDAEDLLDYVTGPIRAAALVLMRRHGLCAY